MISFVLGRPVRLLALIVIWFTAEVLLLGKFAFTSAGDGGELFIPALIASTLEGWQSSLWHPYSTLGTDRAALAFTNVLDRLLFGFLPGWVAYAIHWVSVATVAIVGFYFLARRTLDIPHWAAAAGAFIFFYNQHPNHWVAAAVVLLPMVILATEYVLDNKRKGLAWALFVLAILYYGCIVYLSRIQPFMLIILALWFAIVRPRKSVADWAVIGFGSVLSVVPRLQEVVAVKNFALLSQRYITYGQERMRDDLFEVVIQHYLAPWNAALMAAFLFSGLAIMFFPRKADGEDLIGGKYLIKLLVATGLAMGAVVLLPIVKPVLIDHISLLQSFNLGRLAIYLWVFIALGGTIGLSMVWPALLTYLEKKHPGAKGNTTVVVARRAPLILVGGLLVLSLPQKYSSAMDWVSQGSYKFLFESPVLQSLAERIENQDQPYRAASFEMYPNYLHAYGIETIGGYQVFHTKRFAEFWGKVLRRNSGGPPQKGALDIDRIFLNPVKRPDTSPWPLDDLYRMPLLSLANVKYFVSRDPVVASGWHEIHQASRPWAGMSTREKILSNLKGNFTGRTHLYLYENAEALPRAFFVQRLERFDGKAKSLDALAAADLPNLRTTGYVERDLLPSQLESLKSLSSGKVKVTKYEADRIELSTELSGDGILVVGQNYTPDWSCMTKANTLATFPIDHIFIGVLVPKKTTSIQCRYTPSHKWDS